MIARTLLGLGVGGWGVFWLGHEWLPRFAALVQDIARTIGAP